MPSKGSAKSAPLITGLLAAVLAGAAAFSGAPASAQSPVPDAAHGKILAETNCGRCHAIGLDGASTHKIAPPFWTISERRSVDTIAEMLLTKASPKHSDMPRFTMNAKQATDLAAWIAFVQPIAHGKRFVERNCGRCHAVGVDDKSPHPESPALRDIYAYYPVDALEEGFAEGMVTGHPDMPVFKLTQLQIADVIAYLATLGKR